ncbi:ABC transporter permease [Fulvivirgaceae bacterium PWU5]|uniref:ABC transporter permease n=1 Tax=Dawidia cretensis TaxID=2782350 RepID=A0AAP2GQQ7_9BACT|nr:ABC transporter permease [Dawidia cretensis]MBT1709574.1 ABC transporter permease [Dawidia cretensis]
MNLLENIREGLRSVRANLLRSIITAMIVMLGITALVGVLTAVDGIEQSILQSLSSLGANTFDISSRTNRGNSANGRAEKAYPEIRMTEAFAFMDEFRASSAISLSAWATRIAEVKRLSKKTNPNVTVMGTNEEYYAVKNLEFEQGRSLSSLEVRTGAPVAIVGHKIYTSLYDANANEQVTGTYLTFKGTQFRVIGALKEKGGFSDPSSNVDNMVFISIVKANQLAGDRVLDYNLTVSVRDKSQMEYAMGEATGLMRQIRGDRVGQEDSFELERSEALDELGDLTAMAQVFGFIVGTVTLLGASIALMNIMLVSVTERTREIGVRKALGATPLRIKQQFVIEAIVVCMLGGIAGVILGIVLGNLGSKLLGNDTFIIPWLWMIVGFVVCVLVGLVSGYYPARKASRLDPIESLRFE